MVKPGELKSIESEKLIESQKDFGLKIEKESPVEKREQIVENNREHPDDEAGDSEELKNFSAAVSATAQDDRLAVREKRVEKILEEGMSDIYSKLSPEKKIEFKILGEKTSHQINLLLNEGRLKIKKIIELIKQWLKVVPGINIFFLEQEAKIKADEILKLKKD